MLHSIPPGSADLITRMSKPVDTLVAVYNTHDKIVPQVTFTCTNPLLRENIQIMWEVGIGP